MVSNLSSKINQISEKLRAIMKSIATNFSVKQNKLATTANKNDYLPSGRGRR